MELSATALLLVSTAIGLGDAALPTYVGSASHGANRAELGGLPKDTHSMSLMLAAAMMPTVTVYTGPKPNEAREFGDWIVGCDNEGTCTAIALEHARQEEEAVKLAIVWDSARTADPKVEITPPSEAGWIISIDGRQVIHGAQVFAGKSAHRLVRLMTKGHRLDVKSARGTLLQRASLAGLSAAILYIEEQHGRIGSTTGIMRPGPRRATPPGSVHVTLGQPPRSNLLPAEVNPEHVFADDGCADNADRNEKPTVARLDPETTLVLVPWRCNNGAYNFSYNVMLANNSGRLGPAKLDFPGGMSGEKDGNDLTNAAWDSRRRRLIAHPLGRGIGDCGVHNEYVWDGMKFSLALREVMPTCRGSMRFIPVWRADVMER